MVHRQMMRLTWTHEDPMYHPLVKPSRPHFAFLVSPIVFKFVLKKPIPHKSVNVSFTITDIKNKSTNLCGNLLLQDEFTNILCEIEQVRSQKQVVGLIGPRGASRASQPSSYSSLLLSSLELND